MRQFIATLLARIARPQFTMPEPAAMCADDDAGGITDWQRAVIMRHVATIARLRLERNAARQALAESQRHNRELSEALFVASSYVHPLEYVPRFPSPQRMESPL